MGEETGVGHHPVIRSHRLPVDVPGALQHLERLDHAERGAGELLPQPRDLPDRGEVREEDPAGVQRLLCVLHDPPRLGKVEEDPVEAPGVGVDSGVDVAHVDVEGHVGSEEAVDIGAGAARRSRRGSRSR